MNLYWVVTEDHDEDWFIVAPNENEAVDYHECQEGYDPGEAQAEWICAIPGQVDTGWPSHELLESLGATLIRVDTPRVVELGGRQFSEGMLEYQVRQVSDDMFEARGEPRLNRTERRVRH